ncbi:PREDICTED: neural proliferation differentiation and control protein 1 [Pygoscelis adeliae]|uniref:neural proliferation differentiation and control protein 1 n=2 Tax=Neoaves TaxID=3078114 RepID=UPI0004F4DFF8|nr:PREDICTED: neural proliferation differentiation and control protein 1 [Pygoscelis adeliae]
MKWGKGLTSCGLVDTDYASHTTLLSDRQYQGLTISVLFLYTVSCPRSLDCALQRREFCPPGSGACGPCLSPFQEDDRGQCVQKQLSPSGRTSVPSLEEEIDFLADVLARQEAPRPHPLRDGKPRTSSVPAGGRQHVASGLREGLLQRGSASSKAAPTPSTSTTAAVQKYPVEASPIPSNDDMVLGLIVVCTAPRDEGGCAWGCHPSWVPSQGTGMLQKEVRLAQKADYSAQRVASPLPYDKISPGDKTLAQSAQMYHYQHQKQQMLSMEKHKEEPKLPDSASSDEENEDGDFTVYECPGLAPVPLGQWAGAGALVWVPQHGAIPWGVLPRGPESGELEQPLADPTRRPCSARDVATSGSWALGPGSSSWCLPSTWTGDL